MNYIQKCVLKSVILLGLLTLTACVTTTSVKAPNLDAAYDKRIELGMKYLGENNRDRARYQFSKALEIRKNAAPAFLGYALVHQGNGEIKQAQQYFKKALAAATPKELSSTKVAYGRFLMQSNQAAEACKLFESVNQDYDYSARAEALYLWGSCEQLRGNLVKTKEAYQHALRLDPNYLPPMLDLTQRYFLDGEYDKAKVLLTRFEKLAKHTAQSLWLGVQIEHMFGNRDKEASYAVALKNLFPYSKEYLEYQKSFNP